MGSRVLPVLSLLFGVILTTAASAERHALVIGINVYEELPPLEKAVGDAHAISAKLESLGFTVTEAIDPDRRSLNQAIANFGATLSEGDTALVHFSGHGVEIDGENYLLPGDAPKPQSGGETFVKAEAIAMSALVGAIEEAGAGTRIFIIDACRDNPFDQVGVRSVGGTRGLARVEAPAGTFILYSAGYRQTALDSLGPDDPEPTSVYTRVLLTHLVRAGLTLNEIALNIRGEVEELARTVGHEQRPAYYDELSTRVVLLAEESADETPLAPAAPPVLDPIAADYALAERIGTAAAWEAFLAKYGDDPENFYVRLAQAASEQLAAPSNDGAVAMNSTEEDQPGTPAIEAGPSNEAANAAADEEATAALATESDQGEVDERADCHDGLLASVGTGGAGAPQNCLEPGETFQDCAGCPQMVVIPSGSFSMGFPPNEATGPYGPVTNEGPQHDVNITETFAIGKFEVTRGEFAAFVEETGYGPDPGCWTYEERKAKVRSNRSWQNPGFDQNDSHPVTCMEPKDASAYAEWLTSITGFQYRLPSEAEWEYAARANTRTRYFFGANDLCAYANVADVNSSSILKFSCDDGVGPMTAEVGRYPPNGFGLYDIYGNVTEFTEDCYHENYDGAPSDGTPWMTGDCSTRTKRGGGWFGNLDNMDPMSRSPASDGRANLYGFRVARTLNP